MGDFFMERVFTVRKSFQTMDDPFSTLASKVLAGEASDEEKRALKQLLLESDEYSFMYSRIKEYWDAGVNTSLISDREGFETELFRQLNLVKKSEKQSGIRKLYRKIAGVAAILLCVIAVSFFHLHQINSGHAYTFAAQNEPAEYLLPDGSAVTLNKNSTLTYQSNFGKRRRDVRLSGEGFFDVTKDATRPFSVEITGTRTEVLGTRFNVKEQNNRIITSLVEGSVRFSSQNCNTLLSPGEEVIYHTRSKSYEVSRIDPQLRTAWILRRLNYDDITFGELAEKLEQIYRVKIEINDKKIAGHILSVSFLTEETAGDILDALKDELGFSLSFNADSTRITIDNQ